MIASVPLDLTRETDGEDEEDPRLVSRIDAALDVRRCCKRGEVVVHGHAHPAFIVTNSAIGTANDGGTNHQYDLHDFFDALNAGNLPVVSFVKAIAAQDGHAGYSDPLLEQTFLVNTINALMQSPFWRSTAVIVLYDDSGGWCDHQMSPIVASSSVLAANSGNSDQFNAPGVCGQGTILAGIQGRCGYGPRQPLLVISPFARMNFVDHTLTDRGRCCGSSSTTGAPFESAAARTTRSQPRC